jgi:hypothetical protein
VWRIGIWGDGFGNSHTIIVIRTCGLDVGMVGQSILLSRIASVDLVASLMSCLEEKSL